MLPTSLFTMRYRESLENSAFCHGMLRFPANTTATVWSSRWYQKEIGSGKYDFNVKLPVKDKSVITDEFLYKHASFPLNVTPRR